MSSTTMPLLHQESLHPRPPLINGIPDFVTAIVVPILAYWALSLTYLVIDEWDLFPQYRLHTPEEIRTRNLVGRWECAWNVVQQQIGQVMMGLAFGYVEGPEMVGNEDIQLVWWAVQVLRARQSLSPILALVGIDSLGQGKVHGWESNLLKLFTSMAHSDSISGISTYRPFDMVAAMAIRNFVIPGLRLFVALCVIDTWQYFFHRLMHMNLWCYRKWHSQHHRLYVPYSYGALYGSRTEGFLSETTGAYLAFVLSGMSPRQGMVLFTFGSIKAVTDHSGYVLPWDPLQYITGNNAAYHDLHHQTWGQKSNFSQPFFTFWDDICGTRWQGMANRRAAKTEKHEL